MFTCNRRGFTLIELLVVIAIIATLAAILFPVFAKAREKARQSTCLSNQRQIATALLMYAQDHDQMFPAADGVWGALDLNSGVLKCPTAGRNIANGYGYNSLLAGMAMSKLTAPTTLTLVADCSASAATPNVLTKISDVALRHSDQAVAAYVDGHVEVTKAPTAVGVLPVTDGLVAWYRADAGCSGGSWMDWGPYGLHLNTVSGSKGGELTMQGINGRPAYTSPGNGTTSLSSLPVTANVTLGDTTIIAVINRPDGSIGQDGFSFFLVDINNQTFRGAYLGSSVEGYTLGGRLRHDRTQTSLYDSRAANAGAWCSSSWNVPMVIYLTYTMSGSSCTIDINNAKNWAGPSNFPYTISNGPYTLNGNVAVQLPGYGRKQAIGDLVVYDRVLSTEDRDAVTKYLGKVYRLF